MALHEESVLDSRFGDYVNPDLAGYHIATCADVEELDAFWIDEVDDHLNPMEQRASVSTSSSARPPRSQTRYTTPRESGSALFRFARND